MTEKKFYVYDVLNLKWKGSDGNWYVLSVRQDTDPVSSYEDFGFAAEMYCWHRNYNFGKSHNFASGDAFWEAMVEEYVSDSELLEYAETGNIYGVTLTKNVDGTWDMVFREYPDFSYENEKDWKIIREIMQDLSEEDCQKLLKPYLEWMPVWMYDHSGQTIRCCDNNPFNDRFDSGRLGIIMIDKQKMLEEFEASDDNWREKAREILAAETAEYNEYVEGNVFGYYLYMFAGDEGEEDSLDCSCWEEFDPCAWGFTGNNIFENGMIEDVGLGLEEALLSGNYEEVEFETSTL